MDAPVFFETPTRRAWYRRSNAGLEAGQSSLIKRLAEMAKTFGDGKKQPAPKPPASRAQPASARKKAQAAAASAIVRPGLSFPVVAIGASAGGLEAFTALLKALPPQSGMAFVLIQHLEPKHASALTSLLSKTTAMPVVEVSDGIAAEPDHVYVIPPNKNMTIRKGILRLAPRSELYGLQRPIDDFSIALAEEQGSSAIGVVLSGTGSDGTYGLKAIKAAGGVTFAQDPKTAQWPAMPMSAITAGSVDFVLSPKRIAAELARIGRHPYLVDPREVPEGGDLGEISLLLRSAAGVDFRLYKQATVRRRIARRMALQKIGSLEKYAQVLRQDPAEAQALADDIFIHVTKFFRDPDCFQALRKQVLAKVSLKRRADDPIRIWVAGCSTGEEVYSVTMLLLEQLGEQVHRFTIQIFGTDIQGPAVEHARAGIYTDAAVDGVSPARLKRFFIKTEQGYQIQKFVRDLCVFARHDLAKDPPFSRLDLISCRNVLIYFGPPLQKRVLAIFQYALKPGGFLFLGTSESVSDYSEAFTVADRKHRIFVRKLAVAPFREFTGSAVRSPAPETAAPRNSAQDSAIDFRKEAEGSLLAHYAPPALIVDSDLHIRHIQGDTSPYVALASGPPSFHLLKMVRPEFMVDLRTAIDEAKRRGVAAHKDRVEFEHQGESAAVRLEVRPLGKRNGKQDLLVVFQKLQAASPRASSLQPGRSGAGSGKKHSAEKTEKIERELAAAREHLRALVAEQESSQEEMKVAHEEILSSNEELQSTNEELETAKEELQSSNEELITLNHELQHQNSELAVLTHDLNNLLVGVDIPVLVLDAELRVRRFTPVAGALLNLIPADVGRPFSNIASNLAVSDWPALFSEVIGQGRLIEREVSDRSGHRYSLRMRPYKTSDNRIEGVLLVMLDTDAIYRARDEAQKSGEYARAIVETIREALVVVDSEWRVLTANRSFCDLFRISLPTVEREPFFGLARGAWEAPQLQEVFAKILTKSARIEDLELYQEFPEIGRRHLRINARQIDATRTILIAIEDVTERKRAQEAAEAHAQEVQALASSLLTAQEEERRRVSRELHDQICQQLASLAIDMGGLVAELPPAEEAIRRLKAMQARAVKASEETRLIAYELHPSVLDDLGLVASLRALCNEFSQQNPNIAVEFADGALPGPVPRAAASCLYRVAQASLQNAARHAHAKHVSLMLTLQKDTLGLTITDDGVGFDLKAVKGRSGLGLIGMEERVRLANGKLAITARPGHGTRIAVEVPFIAGSA